jgi:hypothetical protein
MTTMHDDEQLRDDFLRHPPQGVPGGTTRLPRRTPATEHVAFVDAGFVPAPAERDDLGVDTAAGDGGAPVTEARGRGRRGEERVVPELIHVPADTPWEALELRPGSSWDEIRLAHRRLLIQWHPDRHVMETDAEQRYAAERLAEVNAAFAQLRAGHRR